jgi:hypothetical protein
MFKRVAMSIGDISTPKGPGIKLVGRYLCRQRLSAG